MKTKLRDCILLAAVLCFAPIQSAIADECLSLRTIGVGKAAAVETTVASYDAKAEIYNQKLKAADAAFALRSEANFEWPQVLTTRNSLIIAGEAAKRALAEMNGFNQTFAKAKCFAANPADIETEYQSAKARFDTNLNILYKVPQSWQARYAKTDQQEQCAALDTKAKLADKNGLEWAAKYDGLLRSYDQAVKAIHGVSFTAAEYPNLRTSLVIARDQALPGVIGYPDILRTLFGGTLEKHDAGCITMSAVNLDQYKKSRDTLLAEIKQKHSEMLVVETVFPAVVSKVKPVQKLGLKNEIDTLPAPAVNVQIPITEIAKPKRLVLNLFNASGQILCVYNPDDRTSRCNFMPGTSRQIQARRLTVFGGGYWSGSGRYLDMKTCHMVSEDATSWTISGGITSGCKPPA
ncbi:MAG: hypothetical protein COA47_07590 [Robiginitomaculum sp.]|nr:MAG: hypothetical protein COA47_07590 [Robiginitomaculum sp.]